MSYSNENILRYCVIAGGAGLVFVGSIVGLPMPVLFPGFKIVAGALLAGGTAAGLALVHPKPKTEQELLIDSLKDGLRTTAKEVAEAILVASPKLQAMSVLADQIKNPHISKRIRNIVLTGNKILDDFKEDPDDVKVANVWLNVYLDRTVEIIKQYEALSRRGKLSAETQAQLSQFDSTLDDLDKMFEDQYKKLLNNDLMNFDVKMEVLRKTFRSEGL